MLDETVRVGGRKKYKCKEKRRTEMSSRFELSPLVKSEPPQPRMQCIVRMQENAAREEDRGLEPTHKAEQKSTGRLSPLVRHCHGCRWPGATGADRTQRLALAQTKKASNSNTPTLEQAQLTHAQTGSRRSETTLRGRSARCHKKKKKTSLPPLGQHAAHVSRHVMSEVLDGSQARAQMAPQNIRRHRPHAPT